MSAGFRFLSVFLCILSILVTFTLIGLLSCEEDEEEDGDSDPVPEDDDASNDDAGNDDSADDDSQADDDDDSTDQCGEGLWDFVIERFADGYAVIYVWAGYEGNNSDGTQDQPFTTIHEGLNAAYDQAAQGVAVTDGTYNEQIQPTPHDGIPMKIVGRCPEKVTVEMSQGTTVRLRNDAMSISFFTIVGDNRYIIESWGENNRISNNVILGKEDHFPWFGIWANFEPIIISDNELVNFVQKGVVVSEVTGEVKIQNNAITAFEGPAMSHGIIVHQSDDVTISGNSINVKTGYGIVVQQQSNAVVSDNRITDPSEGGISFLSSNGMIEINKVSWPVKSKDVNNYGDGIVVYDASDITIQNNEISDAPRAGIIADATEGMIEINKVTNSQYGLVVQNGSNVTESNNTYEGNIQDYLEDEERVLDIEDQPVAF